MGINLILNSSFESATLSPWQTSGTVTKATPTNPFDLLAVAELDVASAGAQAVLSQIFLVPTGADHFHVSFAIVPLVVSTNGLVTVELQWLGSANVGLPVLQTDTLATIEPNALTLAAWQTYTDATSTAPAGAIWARLRFILGGVTGSTGDIQVDYVFVTTD